MSKRPKATENKAQNTETEKVNAEERNNLAVEFYNLTIQRIKFSALLRETDARRNQIVAQMESTQNAR